MKKAHRGLQVYKWGYALEKLQFTNLDLQICNCKVAMLAFSGYKVPTLHLQNTKLHSSNFGLQVWNDITHMYIYGTTNRKYWFTNLQLHGCNVRILTPLAFHRTLGRRLVTSIYVKLMFGENQSILKNFLLRKENILIISITIVDIPTGPFSRGWVGTLIYPSHAYDIFPSTHLVRLGMFKISPIFSAPIPFFYINTADTSSSWTDLGRKYIAQNIV